MNTIQPTQLESRIHSLDELRGFALLGILIMNIISFSHIGMSYLNPTLGAGIEGYNKYFHAFSYLFADMRFMSLFSMLFGAGVVLFSNNIAEKGKSAAAFHYMRMFFLIIFGFIHAYLIWMGDILVSYALCGSLVFLMRNWKVRTLLIWASIFFFVPILLNLMTYFLTPAEMLEKIFAFWTPTAEEVNLELEAYRGSYGRQLPERMKAAANFQTKVFLIEYLWRVMAMMMVGIALFKKGILSAERSKGFYKKMFGICFSLGLLVSALSLYWSYDSDWNGVWVMNIGHSYNYIASFIMALGYVALLMWWSKSSFMSQLKKRFASVGRMAFTNYILTSLICTFIFYGHGLGYYGSFDRFQQWIVVLIVWAIILFISPAILKKYKQGPLEWLWRKLTYLSIRAKK